MVIDTVFNPCRAEFSLGDMKMYLYFRLSILKYNTELKSFLVEDRERSVYPTYIVTWFTNSGMDK